VAFRPDPTFLKPGPLNTTDKLVAKCQAEFKNLTATALSSFIGKKTEKTEKKNVKAKSTNQAHHHHHETTKNSKLQLKQKKAVKRTKDWKQNSVYYVDSLHLP
jgi:ectoine hydroxylase-related dioxygenase (phytanoyl-CoA dioxygenase family)